ncbi:MAG: biotin/lipoyl-binding protein [Pirellulaceae bacterium]|nr:biotin/lipoyl-binding protein [Pirellulaceae bacterium]
MKGYFLPLVAVVSLAFAGWHLAGSQTNHPPTEPPFAPAKSPFERQVAGLGIVESRTENVAIGSHVPGIVVRVLVKEGDRVPAGQPLLELDTRQAQADLGVKRAMLAAARAELAKLEAMPRQEELPPLAAQLAEMRALVTQREDALARSRQLRQSGAVPEQTYIADQQAAAVARAQLARIEAEDRLLRAGAWLPDKEVARAAVTRAESELAQVQTQLDLHRVLAPTLDSLRDATGEWEVLKVNVRPGEFVSTPADEPLIVLGNTGQRHVRVDIDENDIPRFEPTAKAVAYVRGDNARPFPLRFVRVQPYVVPKRSLSGDNAERVDTRVMQVIYALDEGEGEIYIGQQMDVFLQMTSPAQESPRAVAAKDG